MAELHFRRECADAFAAASPGQINLREFSEAFRMQEAELQLKNKIGQLALSESPDDQEELIRTLAQYKYLCRRALFPTKFVEYGIAGFGSARTEKGEPSWDRAFEIAAQVTDKRRIVLVNGGGTGAMDAFSQGVHEGRRRRAERNKKNCQSRNMGVTIGLPFEEDPSPALDEQSHHSTFATRVPEMLDTANLVISETGGRGTDFENSWAIQLAQVKHLDPWFKILLQRSAWEQIEEAKNDVFWFSRVDQGLRPMVSKEPGEDDTKLATFYDTPEEAVQLILEHNTQWKDEVWTKLDAKSQDFINKRAQRKASEAKQKHIKAAK